MSETEVKGKHPSKLLVLFVLVVGAIAGVMMYLIANVYALSGSSAQIQDGALRLVHVVMTTISIVLLIALLVIYTGTYLSTKANFALGLWIVLLALLLRFILTYPIVLDFTEHISLLNNPLAPISDAFTVIAFSLFLYLSLE